jgi:hypothetical protein
MKDPITRFHLVEHFLGMLIAITLISVGYIRAKKQLPEASAKTIFWFFFIAFVIIMATIPWPFRPYGGAWF